jgi:hypothetical protein
MMKKYFLFAVLVFGLFLPACGGGGGGDGGGSSTTSSGALSLALTDARPALPANIEQVLVTIDEVSVHQSGGGWISLSLAQTPFTVDLLQFTAGHTTQLVPQAPLTAGHYTQVRLGVQSATIVTGTGQRIPMEIASGDLKTDKNFDFDVAGGGAVALTVDFDLSQSIVATGAGTFRLRPVLHLVTTAEAATITGSIQPATFGAGNQATIIVTHDINNSGTITTGDEEYTRLVVDKGSSGPTSFSIFWLIPNQSYIVEVQVGGSTVYSQSVAGASLPTAAVYPLNNGNPL